MGIPNKNISRIITIVLPEQVRGGKNRPDHGLKFLPFHPDGP